MRNRHCFNILGKQLSCISVAYSHPGFGGPCLEVVATLHLSQFHRERRLIFRARPRCPPRKCGGIGPRDLIRPAGIAWGTTENSPPLFPLETPMRTYSWMTFVKNEEQARNPNQLEAFHGQSCRPEPSAPFSVNFYQDSQLRAHILHRDSGPSQALSWLPRS